MLYWFRPTEEIMSSPKVYWTDPLEYEFIVTVTGCEKVDDQFHISVDSDVIRPEGGGQAGDRGEIHTRAGEVQVVNTIVTDDGTRLVTEVTVDEGEQVTLFIDMVWRRSMMRNHTSEHLFVSELKRLREDIDLGYIWIDGDKGTVEILGEDLDVELLLNAEKNVQQHILEDRQVETQIIESKDLAPEVRAREGVESKHDKIRIVRVEGLDQSACSGIHVLNTGDIGLFKILDYRIGDGSARIEFSSHENALNELSSVFNDVMIRRHTYPFEMHQLGDVLDKAKRNADAKEELLSLIVSWIEGSSPSELIAGITFKHYSLPGFESKDLRYILQSMSSEESSAILLFSPGNKSNFILWTTGLEKSATYYASDIVERLDGKGGGSKEVFTGGFSGVVDPQELYHKLVDGIKMKFDE